MEVEKLLEDMSLKEILKMVAEIESSPFIEPPVCELNSKHKLKFGGKKRKGIKPIIEIKKNKKIKKDK